CAIVNGSPSMFQPPSQASCSPKGRVLVAAPRRGVANDGTSMVVFFEAYHGPPASSITTFAPAFVSAYAAMPPPAPEPMIATSYTVCCWDILAFLMDKETGEKCPIAEPLVRRHEINPGSSRRAASHWSIRIRRRPPGHHDQAPPS